MHKKSKRKIKRELNFKKSIHLVLKLKNNLPNLFCPRDKKLREGLYMVAEKYSIQVYDIVFNHTHVHLLTKVPSREAYVAFIRELTSRFVSYWSKKTGIKLQKIFTSRPFTRVVEWGRDFFGVKRYLEKNERESGAAQLKNFFQIKKYNSSVFLKPLNEEKTGRDR